MNKHNYEYFGAVINKLKEAKASEKIVFDESFKRNLRKQLVVQAKSTAGKKFDYREFFQRAKLIFGLIPTFAILAIVALNFSNLKILFKGDNKMEGVSDNAPLSLDNNTNQSVDEEETHTGDWEIKTFPGYLVMPPQYKRGFTLSVQNLTQSTPTQHRTQNQKTTSVPAGAVDPSQGEVVQNTYIQDISTELQRFSQTQNTVIPQPATITSTTENAKIENTNQTQDIDEATKEQTSTSSQTQVITGEKKEEESKGEIVAGDSKPSELESVPNTETSDTSTDNVQQDVSSQPSESAALSANKIIFSSDFNQTEKNILTRIVLHEFGRKGLHLDQGYYFKIELLLDSNVKVNLYQKDQITHTLTLQKNGSSYVVF